VILALTVAVIAVTVLLLASLVALWRGHRRLHGRINIVFFILTLAALLGLEVIARVLNPEIFKQYFEQHNAETALVVHLCFSIPSALLLLVMLPTGLRRYRRIHIGLGIVFLCLWAGTLVTGVFFLPDAVFH
jgi:uncharacterized membrane protein YozB (DUF420 family)